MYIGRRNFIKTGMLATTSLFVPKLLQAFNGKGAIPVPPGHKVVVVLQLNGGNDGLNTTYSLTKRYLLPFKALSGIEKG